MVYLNVHSNFSLMKGLYSPQELCEAVKNRGGYTLAITDINGLYGLPDFLSAAEENKIKPIVGVDLSDGEKSCIVLIRNLKGYQKICRHLTKFHLHKESIFKFEEDFFDDKDFFIFTKDKDLLLMFKSYGLENIFFELTRGYFNHQDVLWCLKYSIKFLANNRVFYLEKEDRFFFKLLRAIDQNQTFNQVDTRYYENEFCYMWSQKEFENYFRGYPDAITNLQKIVDSVDSSWFKKDVISPGFNGLTEQECNKKLKEKCLKRIHERYDVKDEAIVMKVRERLNYELDIIAHKKFSSYFLNVEEIANECDFTCGRGSSAASLVNYLLEITHVDPIKEDLLFDRFMNLDRMDPPDIDIDFPSDQRDDVLDIIFKRFEGRVAMVANHNYLRDRSAVREVAKVMGIKEDEISYTIDRLQTIELNKKWKEVLFYACKLQGAIRHLSVHCGGVIITPNRIDDYVPVELSNKGYPVIQWEKDQTEMAGLVKTDILGNKGLSVIRDVINRVNEQGESLSYKNLNPVSDSRAQDLFRNGHTVGVIHFESPRCRTLLAAFNDYTLSTLSIVCSIIRPAAMIQVTEMLRRFKGGRFTYPHKAVEQTLGSTLGIMVYQEDVMRITKALAGFTSQEGNELRKVLAKKHKQKRLSFYKEKFFNGCAKNNINEEDTGKLWADILSFAGYSFCKPHSDSYSLVAYKSAYLKAYYPAEFMAAVISNGGGFYVGNIEDYLNEARRMGVAIYPPDINDSDYDYKGENFKIRVGLKQIKHIKRNSLKKILAERLLGPFLSIEDFLERTCLSFDEARILLKARCYGSVRKVNGKKLTHIELMWKVYEFFARKEGKLRGSTAFIPSLDSLAEYSKEKLICWELEFLNGFVTFPSWFLYRDLLKKRHITPGSDLKRFIDKEVIVYGQKVNQKRVATKYGEHMSFVTFSDDTCMFNTTFFPQAYNDFRDLLFLGGSFLIKGVVQNDLEGQQVIVSGLTRIGEI